MSNTSVFAYLILALAIGYAFVYSPMGDLSALDAKKTEYEESIETINNIEEMKQDLLTKFESIPEADRNDIDTIIPTSENFMKLVSQIDAVASRYGISIENIASMDSSSSNTGSIENAQAQPYKSVVVSFSFYSSYKNFKLFMNDLEKSLRILDIRTVDLTTDTGGINSYDVSFETYWLN